jgi:methyl-accepting chemotaxis protein
VRLTLSLKFFLGSLAVSAVVVVVPPLVEAMGLVVVPWVTPFLALGAGAGLGLALSRQLVGRYEPILALTHRIGQGDLRDADLSDRVLQDDETGRVAAGIIEMLDDLRGLVGSTRDGAHRISEATEAFTASVEHTHRASSEISQTVAEVARASSHQQERLGDVTQLITEIATAVESNASRAREAFGFAAEANQKAHSGVDVSRLAIEKMRSVFERVEQAGGNVFALEEKTRHVHQITEIITSVASRTNLLSLNASIEAARAGEAGRGFAVVADEIRKLAESAARSADEISKLVGEIEADTQRVADEMRESGQMITEGREDVNTIAGSLGQIRSAVGEAATRAEEIFQQADTQARDAERMVQSMDEAVKVSLANAAAVDDVARTSNEQMAAVSQMVSQSDDLVSLAHQLGRLTERFRTGAEEAS